MPFKYAQFIIGQLYLNEGRMEGRKRGRRKFVEIFQASVMLPTGKITLYQQKETCLPQDKNPYVWIKKWNSVGFFHLLITQEDVDKTTA